MARLVHILSPLCLWACAQQDIEPATGKARFSEYPRSLVTAFESFCDSPAKTLVRPTRHRSECRMLMPPMATAAVIFEYGGTPEKLPQVVIGLNTNPDPPGYLVSIETYLRVPQTNGQTLHAPYESRSLDKKINEVFVRSGGRPE